LVTTWGQADVRRNASRVSEAIRGVDDGDESSGGDRANAGNGHHSTDQLMRSRRSAQQGFEQLKLPADRLMRSQKRRKRCL
jgi:hypothetical protein